MALRRERLALAFGLLLALAGVGAVLSGAALAALLEPQCSDAVVGSSRCRQPMLWIELGAVLAAAGILLAIVGRRSRRR
jgi:hypothetical protein